MSDNDEGLVDLIVNYKADSDRWTARAGQAEAEVVRLKAAVKTARDFAFQGVHEPDSRHYCKAILELLEKVPGIPSARVVEAGRYGRRKSGGKARAERAL